MSDPSPELEARLAKMSPKQLAYVFERMQSRINQLEGSEAGAEVPNATIARESSELAAVGDSTAIEYRPLPLLIAAGKIKPVDAVTLKYIPGIARHSTGLSQHQIVDGQFGGLPWVFQIIESELGRLACIWLPGFKDVFLDTPEQGLEILEGALRFAKGLGARVAGLTGQLQGAIYNFGTVVAERFEGRSDLAIPTTTNANIWATSLLGLENLLETAGRSTEGATVAFVGCTIHTDRVMELMLDQLPHPAKLVFAENEPKFLQMARERLQELDFRGQAEFLASESDPLVYRSRLIVSTKGRCIDVDRLAPGTLLLDVSYRDAADPRAALNRIQTHQDILIQKGYIFLRTPTPSQALVYLNKTAPGAPPDALNAVSIFNREEDPYAMMNICDFGPLLSAADPSFPPMVGPATLPQMRSIVEALRRLRYVPAFFRCGKKVRIPRHLVEAFCQKFAGT